MTDKTIRWHAVLGDPVAHSKSPQIHTMFSKQTGISMNYTRIRIPAEEFDCRLREMIAHGIAGANVTVPHKLAAYRISDQQTERARLAESANTLTITNNTIIADNTDGIGLVTDIEENAMFSLMGRRLLLIGAGGAVRGVLGAIISRKPTSIVITNRSISKAVELAKRFSSIDPTIRIEAKSFEAINPTVYDCIINGTSASLNGSQLSIPDHIFSDCPLVYDMMYAATPTPFLQTARESGAMMTRDGLGMLVEQAAESFYVWNGVKPETHSVLAALRGSLSV